MKLALGTVQFGTNYGISNKQGQVSLDEVKKILTIAKENNISLLDTAPSYGDSEQVLGEIAGNMPFEFISKTPPNCSSENFIGSTKASIDMLKVDKLYGVLTHNSDALLSATDTTTYQALLALKNKYNLCEKIGCSVYSPIEALNIAQKFNVDIFQIPANLFDQRILKNNVLTNLSSTGAEIHIRSLFLQGVFFLPLNNLPRHLEQLRPQLKKLHQLHQDNKIKLIATVLAPFIQNKLIDKVVIGCCSAQELLEIISAYNIAKTLTVNLSQFEVSNENLIDPRRWNK